MSSTVLVACRGILAKAVLVYHAIQMIQAVLTVVQMVLSAITVMK
jgi:hypothetical protein